MKKTAITAILVAALVVGGTVAGGSNAYAATANQPVKVPAISTVTGQPKVDVEALKDLKKEQVVKPAPIKIDITKVDPAKKAEEAKKAEAAKVADAAKKAEIDKLIEAAKLTLIDPAKLIDPANKEAIANLIDTVIKALTVSN